VRPATTSFPVRVAASLGDTDLQRSLGKLQERFVVARARAVAEFDKDFSSFEQLRDHAAAIRDHTLAHLDRYLERFEEAVARAGGEVHWAEDAAAANRILLEIIARHGVRKVAKSKSMVSEECGVNGALEAAGIEVVETDLGEYILQLADEPPSHIVAPVMHKHKEEVAELFEHHHRRPRQHDIAALVAEAREILRPHFLSADLGFSGANFLVAETGSAVIVTNEGNGRMVTTLPRVHVALAGIEKLVPTLEDAATMLRLLPRSATGQPITNYVSFLTGPRRAGDLDGPEHFHVVLLDSGRSRLLDGELRTMLRCIRCGACLNHCPVYQSVGGHAYGWVYPGPMGSVLTPALLGLEQAPQLPDASTLCGACEQVCPVKIPLPELLRKLRAQRTERQLRPWGERLALRLWAWCALRPRVYATLASVAVRLLAWLGGNEGLIRRLPLAAGWLKGRDLPAPAGRTFRELYKKRERR
jgi:L-lactate dehydrogenase complex protein LldF